MTKQPPLPTPDSQEDLRTEIARLESSVKVMRQVNEALAKGDDNTLRQLNFEEDHIELLKQKAKHGLPGFPQYTIRNIRRDIARLKRMLITHDARRNGQD